MVTSPVYLLNRSGSLSAPPRALLEVLQLSRSLSEQSDGGFDVTMLPLLTLHSERQYPDPATLQQARNGVDYRKLMVSETGIHFAAPGMAITLDGIGKGYIVDQGVAALKEQGFAQVYVDAGGDLMVTGSKPDGSPWRIGIMNPRKDHTPKPVVVNVTDRAVATSGDYFQAFTPDLQNHHIIDPHTGFSSPELASCTVTAPSVVLADGLATAVMVLGREKGLELLESMDGCEGYLIDKELNSSHTAGFFS
jgi:thiamine biosynthesis lipoprotein